MILYHGSKNGTLTSLKKMQATAKDGVGVPKDELLEAIYLTPDYGFALACAARPTGLTQIDNDGKKITFENPHDFGPEQQIYVYEVEVPDNKARAIDAQQYVVEDASELIPIRKNEHRARDVGEYYELSNWHEPLQESQQNLKVR